MGLQDIIDGAYAKIEDAFYGFLDFLDEKGVPVYAVVDPLEERGIPALPLALFLVLLVGFVLFGVILAPRAETTLQFSILEAGTNTGVNGVSIEIRGATGKLVADDGTLVNNGQKVPLSGVGIGEDLEIIATKSGYLEEKIEFSVSPNNNPVTIQLQKDVQLINGKIKLLDARTGDEVINAEVLATLSDSQTVLCSYTLSEKVYSCPQVQLGEQVEILIKSSNYEQLSFATKLYEDAQSINLTPRDNALVGQTSLIIRVLEFQTKKPVPNVTVQVYDAIDDSLISDLSDEDGELLTLIDKGTSVRLVASAEGFVRSDSEELGATKTLRSDEEIWEVLLVPGGASVTVIAKDLGGLPQSFATIQLFDSQHNLVDLKETSLGGEVIFDDLSVEQVYTATAYKQGFLPTSKEFAPTAGETLELTLEQTTSSNSSRVNVFVTDDKSVAANNTTLNFFEKKDGLTIPMGLPQQKTDISGKFSFSAKNGSTIVVEAFKEGLEGREELTIQTGQPNELLINMIQTEGIVKLVLLDATGNPISAGHVKIESIEGDRIDEFDIEGLEEGEEIFFDSEEREFVKVTFTDLLGNTFVEEINVKGKTEAQLRFTPGKSTTGLSPTITFKEITRISGEKVEGINKVDPFYLVFEVVFPQGPGEHGFHVRVGDDTIKHSDSDEVGITGFSASADNHFYGRTYSMLPEPGAEGIDFQNEGNPGEFNKFLETYFSEGGTKIIKVKVQAKETTTSSSFDLHFRAWSKYGNDFYRAPADSVLGKAFFSEQKNGLYAQTNLEQIKIFEAKNTCRQDVCVSYKFVEESGAETEPADFSAAKGKKYALLVQLNPSVDIEATLRVATSRTAPKFFWQGYAIETASVFPDNNKLDTTLEVNGILAPADKAINLLLFFNPVEIGNAQATIQVITPGETVTDNIFFAVFEEQELVVTTNPDNILFGENFSFEVKSATGAPIENAVIMLRDETAKHLQTIVGNGSTGKGGGGIYDIQNSFDTAVIGYEVTATSFKPAKGEVRVFKKDVLSLPEEIVIPIPRNPPSTDRRIQVQNNSQQLVQDVSFEIIRKPNFASGLNVRATSLPLIEPNSSQTVIISADYSGSAQRAHGEAILVATGRLDGKYLVRAESKLILDFNPVLPLDCIEFSKSKLVIFVESGFDNRNAYNDLYEEQYYNPALRAYDYAQVPQNNYFGLNDELGFSASRFQSPYNRFFGYTNTKQLEFTIRNKCDAEIELVPQVVARALSENEGLNIQVNSVKLKPSGTTESGRRTDEQKVTVAVTNTMLRNYPSLKPFSFDIFFTSDSVTKAIPLDIMIWNPRYALEVTRNIELWLTQENPSQAARAVSPIFARNVGHAPIENLSFSVASASLRGNTMLRVQPSFPVQFLQPGQALNPPKTLIAEATRTESNTSPLETKQIDVYGLIDGRNRYFGPIFVTTHLSGSECLKATPNAIEFFSENTTGALSKKIRLKNTCADEVRITAISPNQFGSNFLVTTGGELTLAPGTEREVEIILNKKEAWEAQTPVFFDAILVRSGSFIRSNPLNVDLRLGKNVSKAELAFEEKEVLVCETAETKVFRFPKLSTGTNCETAYCDAEQLAGFIVEKAAQKLEEAKRNVANYKGEVVNTACGADELRNGYCGFGGLNVREETFSVFFSNDNITPELLKRVADSKAKEIAGFRYDYLAGENAGAAIGQIGKKFLLSQNFSSCGKYNITIGGAVKVNGIRLDSDLTNLFVNVVADESETGKQETEQCQPKIQNISNFLPKDKGTQSIEESNGAWASIIDPQDEALKDAAEQLSQRAFGSEKRGQRSGVNTNKLLFGFGSPQGYVVQVSMEKSQEAGPRKFDAFVQTVAAEGGKSQVINEAVLAIAGLLNNSVDGCISQNEDYVLLKSAGTVKGLEIGLDACIDQITKKTGTLSIMNGQENCCSFSVSSEVSEKIKILPTFTDARIGISEPVVKNARDKTALSSAQNDGFEISLVNKDEKSQKFKSELLLCVTGDKDAQAGHGKKLELEGRAIANSERKTQPKEINLQFCGIHPTELYDALFSDAKKEKGTYYFTPSWKGTEPSIAWEDIRKIGELRAFLKDAKETVESSTFGLQTQFQADQKTKKLEGLGLYTLSCGAASALFGLKFGYGVFMDPIIDCAIPASNAAADLFDSTREGKQWLFDLIVGNKDRGGDKGGIPVLGSIVSWAAGQTGKAADALVDEPVNIDDSQTTTLAQGALTSVGTYSLYRGITDSISLLGPLTARNAAAQVCNQLASEIIRTNFSRLAFGASTPTFAGFQANTIVSTNPNLRNFFTVYQGECQDKTFAALRKYYGQSLDKPLGQEGTTALKNALAESIEEVAKEPTVQSSFSKITGDLLSHAKQEEIKHAKEAATKAIFNKEELYSEALNFSETTQIPIEPSSSNTALDLVKLDAKRNQIAQDLFDATWPKIESQVKEKAGEEFLRAHAPTMKTEFQNSIKNSISSINPEITHLKNAQGLTTTLIEKGVLTVDEKTIKKAIDVALKKSVADATVKTALEEGIGKKISTNIIKEFSHEAEGIIVNDAGKFKLNWTKFQGLLRSVFTKTFWKDLLKGGAGGLISNAVGLFTYNKFMEEYGRAELPTDSFARPVGSNQLSPPTFALNNYSTYKVEVGDDGKPTVPELVSDFSAIPSDAHWLNKCSSNALAAYDGLPRIVPDPKQFTDRNVRESIPVAIKYIESAGRVLRTLDAPKNYGIPESLVVTTMVLNIQNDGKTLSDDWVTGCNITDSAAREIPASLHCAAAELRTFYNQNCGPITDINDRAVCALKAYNDDNLKNPNFDQEKIKKNFEAWYELEQRAT